MTERVHPDLENGFVHRSDGSILPIVAMIDRDREKTDQPDEAVIVVAGTELAGFIVVAMKGHRLQREDAVVN
jgi:hypothetical protein